MYGIGAYTFARYRVAWKRMAARMEATVLTLHKTPFGTKPVVAMDTTSLFAAKTADEAHYLCAILNSRTVDEYIRSFSSGGRGFGAPSVVKNLAIPLFAEGARIHRRLSGLSRQAHEGVGRGRDTAQCRGGMLSPGGRHLRHLCLHPGISSCFDTTCCANHIRVAKSAGFCYK